MCSFYLQSQHERGSPHLQTSAFNHDALKSQSCQTKPRQRGLRWSYHLYWLCSSPSHHPKHQNLANFDCPFVLQFLPLSFLVLLIFAFMLIKSCLKSLSSAILWPSKQQCLWCDKTFGRAWSDWKMTLTFSLVVAGMEEPSKTKWCFLICWAFRFFPPCLACYVCTSLSASWHESLDYFNLFSHP